MKTHVRFVYLCYVLFLQMDILFLGKIFFQGTLNTSFFWGRISNPNHAYFRGHHADTQAEEDTGTPHGHWENMRILEFVNTPQPTSC